MGESRTAGYDIFLLHHLPGRDGWLQKLSKSGVVILGKMESFLTVADYLQLFHPNVTVSLT